MTTAGIAMAQNNAPQGNDMPHSAHGKPFKGKHHNKNGLPRGFDDLGLTDAQKNKIKSIMEKSHPAKPSADTQETRRQAFMQKMQQRQAQEQQLMTSKTFNEQAARNMIAEHQQERANMEKEHAERELQMMKTQHEVFQVLTPAQQNKFLENQKEHQKRFEQMRKQHNAK